MAIIDMVRWVPDENDETVFAYRFPETNLSTYTQLVVQESQEAVLFSKGQIVGKFGPGKHTLDTENLPILRSLFGLPFGGKNPFTAEVWFVNKLKPADIEWRTSQMSVHDPDYNTYLPLVAVGQYGLKVVDAEKFLINIVGTRSEFRASDLTNQFYGESNARGKSAIVSFMTNNRIGYKGISGYLAQLSDWLKDSLSAFWGDYGLELTKFFVSGIDIDTSTEEGRSVAEAIAQQTRMSITGHTWQQEQMFGTANNAINSMSNGAGGLLGSLAAVSMMGGFGGGGVGQQAMQSSYGQQPNFSAAANQAGGPSPAGAGNIKMVFCSNCGKKYANTVSFCPSCGDPYNPCPNCGTDNDTNARRCVSCGTVLSGGSSFCSKCNSPIVPGSAFCPNCGNRVGGTMPDDVCKRCGTTIPVSSKFCPKCGNRR